MAEEADPWNEVVVEVEAELVAHILPVFTVMSLTYLLVSISHNTVIKRFVIWATNISIRVNAHPAVRRHVSHLVLPRSRAVPPFLLSHFLHVLPVIFTHYRPQKRLPKCR